MMAFLNLRNFAKIAIFLTFLVQNSIASYNIDDSILHAIHFNKPSVSNSEQDEALLDHPPELVENVYTVTMTTAHNEKYTCQLPTEEKHSPLAAEEYTGPSVLQLLERLFVQSACAYRYVPNF